MPVYETWTLGICEYCQKNSHRDIKMKREKIVGYNNKSEKFWVCPNCGAPKAFNH